MAQPRAAAFAVNAEREDGLTEVQCRFVRGRNALICAGDFAPMFMDLYLHLGQNGVVLAGGADEKIKTLLAALALHAAARPHHETCAWTVHLEREKMNLFAVAENPSGRVTGQVFAENVRATGGNVLHAEVAGPTGRRRSSVDFNGPDVLLAAASYYGRSEQRPARYFALGGDRFALLAAQPDCDTGWLLEVGDAEVLALADDDSRPPLETRHYRFSCGCSPERVAAAIAPALRGDLEGIFGGDAFITVTCPRCGLRHELARGLFDVR